MKNQLKQQLSILFFFSLTSVFSQTTLDVDRWKIKTSAQNLTSDNHPEAVTLKKLLTLPLLPQKFSTNDFSEILIPEKIATLKEGDIIPAKRSLSKKQ